MSYFLNYFYVLLLFYINFISPWVMASLVAERKTFSGEDASLLSQQLAALTQFDATSFILNGSTRCGQAPTFPVGQQTLVKVATATGERQFILYIPTSYNPRGRVALQVLFHGLNDNCGNFINATGFIPLAERDGYILASACGSLGLLGVGWNAGTCCGFMSPDSPDDFNFAASLVGVVGAGSCVDSTRVAAVGFSNGAMMAQALGCRRAPVFRLIASVGGIIALRPGNAGGLEACAEAIHNNNNNNNNPDNIRPSVLMVHGNLDPIVPVGGDALLGFPPLADNVVAWVSINGCTDKVNTTIDSSKYRNEVHNDCDSARNMEKFNNNNNRQTAMEDTSKDSLTLTRKFMWKARDIILSRFKWKKSSGPDLHRSIVEIVHALYGGHSWPEDNEFSTTQYIYEFGKRVFSNYTVM